MSRELTPNDYELLLRLDESVPKRNVLKSPVVARFNNYLVEGGGGDCGVCLSPLEPGEDATRLPCGSRDTPHVFHQACISKWLTECRNSCPLCGQAVGGGKQLPAEERPDNPADAVVPF